MNIWKMLLLVGFLQVTQVSHAEQNQDGVNTQAKRLHLSKTNKR